MKLTAGRLDNLPEGLCGPCATWPSRISHLKAELRRLVWCSARSACQGPEGCTR